MAKLTTKDSPVTRREMERIISDAMKETLKQLESINAVKPVLHTVRHGFRRMKTTAIKELEGRGFERKNTEQERVGHDGEGDHPAK